MLIGIGMGIGGRGGSSGDTRTLTFVAGGGSSAATTAPSGIAAGDALLGIVLKTTTTAPTFDATVGWTQIGTFSSNSTSGIVFWKYAESSTPAFGTHTGGTRCQWWAWRFSDPPVAPFGTPIRDSDPASIVMGWAGLTLTKQMSQVATIGHRNADDPIAVRTDALQVQAPVGATSRYAFMRSNGAVGSWPSMDLAQAVSGVHQSIAVEVGY
jgi:hypothetical protein